MPYERYLTPPGSEAAQASAAAQPPPSNDVSPLGAILGVALLGGMLLIGVLLGRGEGDSNSDPTPAITTTAASSTLEGDPPTTPATDSTTVTSDWPSGQDGFTIELGTLPKDATTSADVDATKADLSDQGASDLGVLDSDLYPSLPTGNYVVYSGVFETEEEASSALAGLTDSFPNAALIEVSQNASGGGGGVKESTGSTQESSGSDAQANLDEALEEATDAAADAAQPVIPDVPTGQGAEGEQVR